jgi:hypothetical protein
MSPWSGDSYRRKLSARPWTDHVWKTWNMASGELLTVAGVKTAFALKDAYRGVLMGSVDYYPPGTRSPSEGEPQLFNYYLFEEHVEFIELRLARFLESHNPSEIAQGYYLTDWHVIALWPLSIDSVPPRPSKPSPAPGREEQLLIHTELRDSGDLTEEEFKARVRLQGLDPQENCATEDFEEPPPQLRGQLQSLTYHEPEPRAVRRNQLSLLFRGRNTNDHSVVPHIYIRIGNTDDETRSFTYGGQPGVRFREAEHHESVGLKTLQWDLSVLTSAG